MDRVLNIREISKVAHARDPYHALIIGMYAGPDKRSDFRVDAIGTDDVVRSDCLSVTGFGAGMISTLLNDTDAFLVPLDRDVCNL